ncbi:Oidioi.mRNA.OKI2018_I69.chr2.g7936.t1.cds [Oikopleura dioica]|uniref:Oidioi.mRNA.OKI2018_I69.chr2.g7936.t1.cds n=1 Tax=Oikopleura dioica TaxID=34765 RepID=A0ABN7TG53_OIKDI|nr:Oidioi.mRNA.OKI2018_I69.chr2.g7936.t1.cds [Oikopleura dioica]
MNFLTNFFPLIAAKNLEQAKQCSLENALVTCSLSNSILQIPEMDCEMIEEIIPSCMRVRRGPPGQKMIQVPFEQCLTEVFINDDGFFSYRNSFMFNGEVKSFTCNSKVNSLVSLNLSSDDEDQEHMADNSKIFDIELLEKGEMEEYTIEISAQSQSVPSFLEYRVESCVMTDHSGVEMKEKQIVEDFCPAIKLVNALPSGGLPFYETTKIRFMTEKVDKSKISTKCDLRICLRGSENNLCETQC